MVVLATSSVTLICVRDITRGIKYEVSSDEKEKRDTCFPGSNFNKNVQINVS